MGLTNLVICFNDLKKIGQVGTLMEGNGYQGLGLKYDFIQEYGKFFCFEFGYFKCLMMFKRYLNPNLTKSDNFSFLQMYI